MNLDTTKYKVWNWRNPLMLHWILNPGLAINELILGQRIPKITLLERVRNKPLSERSFIPCPQNPIPSSFYLWKHPSYESIFQKKTSNASYETNLGLIMFPLPVLISYGQNQQTESSEFFDSDNFLGDTLFIEAQYTKCGEWGGHQELSKIYLKDANFHIVHQKFAANCGGIKANNGKPSQTISRSISKVLLDDDKLLIRRYMHQLLNAKFRESIPMHSDYIFQIKNSNNSLNIVDDPPNLTTKSNYEDFIKRITE